MLFYIFNLIVIVLGCDKTTIKLNVYRIHFLYIFVILESMRQILIIPIDSFVTYDTRYILSWYSRWLTSNKSIMIRIDYDTFNKLVLYTRTVYIALYITHNRMLLSSLYPCWSSLFPVDQRSHQVSHWIYAFILLV